MTAAPYVTTADVAVTAIGAFDPSDTAPRVVLAGAPLPAGPAGPETFGDRLRDLQRASGIPRPRSAASASVWASTLAAALLEHLGEGTDRTRIGLSVASTSSTARVAYDFDVRGLVEGWDLVDAGALPNTIPTAVATQPAIAHGLQGFATVTLDGLLGVVPAVEIAAVMIARGDVDAALVVVTEELSAVQMTAYRTLGAEPVRSEGAAGLLLKRAGPGAGGWVVRRTVEGGGKPGELPRGWSGVPVTDVRATAFSALQSLSVPALLATILAEADGRVVLRAVDPVRGWNGLCLEHTG